MGAAIRLVDEEPNGKIVRETILELAGETITARALIECRVQDEVARFNRERNATVFAGLVQPTETETVLNGYRLRKPRLIDPEEQCARAFQAFEANGFFMLADDRQIESLDEVILIRPNTKVSFVKLVPLVGG
jgi:hypothetical protein